LTSVVDHLAMVVAGSPVRSPGADCSVARRAGAIVSGPSPVLLPPDGPSDHHGQLREDATTLLALRSTPTDEECCTWAGVPLVSVAEAAQAIARQLAPIRSRDTLLASWEREAARGPDVRLAYAMVWLALDGAETRRRLRRRARRTTGLRR
jgi:hypothetical protein